MNFLIFIIALILAVTLATTGHLSHAVDELQLRRVHHPYLLAKEREEINTKAWSQYHRHHFSKEGEDVPDPSSQEEEEQELTAEDQRLKEEVEKRHKISRQKFLNLHALFFDDDELPQEYAATYELAKRLLLQLYGHTDFFIEAAQKHPDLADDLLQRLRASALVYKKEKGTLNQPDDLSHLDLGNEELRLVFFKIMRGSDPEKDSKNGYPSFSKFIVLHAASNPIRVQLTDPALLLAFFEDPAVVKEILQERQRFQRKVKNKALTTKEATTEFSSLFQDKAAELFRPLLTFEITSTRVKT